MKKILITGVKSYIGNSFKSWINQWPDKYYADFIDVRGDEWKDKTFNSYDVVYHLAAIVHLKMNDREENFFVRPA